MPEFLTAANEFVSAFFNSLKAVEQRLFYRSSPHPCAANELHTVAKELRKVSMRSSRRFASMQDFHEHQDLPPGMDRWANIVVHTRYGQHFYKQAVSLLQNQRCCIECQLVLASTHHLPALALHAHDVNYIVEYTSYMEVFCSGLCHEKFFTKRKGCMARRLLESCEHGVCCQCNVDTIKLQRCLSKMSQDERKFYFSVDGSATLVERNFFNRLSRLRQAKVLADPGKHLWEADHIRAVADGGGESGLDNMQTLCVACHASKTQEEKRRRALAKRAASSSDFFAEHDCGQGVKEPDNARYVGERSVHSPSRKKRRWKSNCL